MNPFYYHHQFHLHSSPIHIISLDNMKLFNLILHLFLFLTAALAAPAPNGNGNNHGNAAASQDNELAKKCYKTSGLMPGEQVKLSTPMSEPKHQTFAPMLLGCALKSQLHLDKPVYGKTYVFTAYKEGNPLENFFNGGAHAFLLLAEWADPSKVNAHTPAFQASTFDLIVDWRPENERGPPGSWLIDSKQIAELRRKTFSDKRAQDWAENLKYNIKALGISKAGEGKSFQQLAQIVEDQSDAYFEGEGRHYEYVTKNCGSYVKKMLGVVKAEKAS
ncbi:uncharacterized protein K452DRAFT_334785 [Aplosporella prunicola CBS 121167]|uniref:Uncharacterized protein n=1 Tax=Aplosporella prunicola CBS 121167 TaxID=1176127 RepID=A0A6A6B8L3_9PEZI|nr:uncharacterized protein K452DRAFT_334785 [Aplosporella prunicola CBS 121167]KAF2140450.1 hypothetical protein K452DRAFT_334785 [Aplosporella prunicola CBS 121167]